MHYSVLLVDNDIQALDIAQNELSQRGLNVISVTNFEDACSQLKKDGTIHAVLSEWNLPVDRKGKTQVEGLTIFKKFMELRYEVNLFLYTHINDSQRLTSGGIINGYFFKGDNVYDDIVRKIVAQVNDKNRAPFYERLVKYAHKAKDSWHTPGHASGNSVRNSPYVKDYYEFFGENLFTSDVSVSVPELDSLLHPIGVIKEAQELASRAFNSRYTFFSTNGTSTSNKVLIQTLLKPGDAILLDHNCHKSVHYGVIIAGAEPIYLMPSINNKYGIFGPIPKQRIIEAMDKAIKDNKSLKAIILTNCTYDGLMYDIQDIVEEAHKRNIKVIVDEAWFGYANFHREFYPSAMAAGADYSTQSTHKTMSAFSQASMIHVNDPDFEDIEDMFMENFNMHASTSPQYPMIASLDVATKQMVMEGYGLLQRVLDLSNMLRKSINSLKKFRVLELDDLISPELKDDNIRVDKTKLTIDISKSGYTSKELEHLLLTKHNIQIEKSTFNTITILLTIGATYSRINRLYLALENIERHSGNRKGNGDKILKNFKLELSPLKYRPRFAFYSDDEMLSLQDALNRISTRMVTPYPPGIPLLVPGQIITKEIINALQMYRNYGVEIHGMDSGMVKVMTPEAEQKLKDEGIGLMN
ncbi:MAG: aminotransferase class I/II-fold pyridoxal phosphate-dependent enzyme [Bacteroidota bacterium]|jgi:arginine/lysine/ornithine decarboxylase